jgi:hypothetical protein
MNPGNVIAARMMTAIEIDILFMPITPFTAM